MPKLVHVTTVPMSLVFLRGQAEYMRRRGFDVWVVSSAGDQLDEFASSEGVRTRTVGLRREVSPFQDLRALIELTRVFRELRPDIVHGHTPKGGLLAVVAAKMCGVPVILYHLRGLPLETARGMMRAVTWLSERIACALAHRVICVSDSLRTRALNYRITSPERALVIGNGSGNGVDADVRFNPDRVAQDARQKIRNRLGIPPDAAVVGWVGRIVVDKGILEMADAWAALSCARPGVHLLIIGPVEDKNAPSAGLLNRLHGDDRVHMVGAHWDLGEYYCAMDVVAFPTHREGFPNVPLEAAAMGLPVVATRTTGCVDAVVDGLTGTLVPPHDGGALATALGRYLDDGDLRRQHGLAARARVSRDFRPADVWSGIHALYTSLMDEQGMGKS